MLTVSPARFARQMRWLKRLGLRGVSAAELLSARRDGEANKLVGLTFDDGYADFVEYALPVLLHYNFSATVFAVAGLLGDENSWSVQGPRKPLIDADQLRQLADLGIEIGSHGLRHVRLPGTSCSELTREINLSRTILQAASGHPVRGFCYPYGQLDSRIVDAVRTAGYEYACAIRPWPQTSLHSLPRIYISDSDSSLWLWAKGLSYRLKWDYKGPGSQWYRRVTANN